jgi:hypothetical protein
VWASCYQRALTGTSGPQRRAAPAATQCERIRHRTHPCLHQPRRPPSTPPNWWLNSPATIRICTEGSSASVSEMGGLRVGVGDVAPRRRGVSGRVDAAAPHPHAARGAVASVSYPAPREMLRGAGFRAGRRACWALHQHRLMRRCCSGAISGVQLRTSTGPKWAAPTAHLGCNVRVAPLARMCSLKRATWLCRHDGTPWRLRAALPLMLRPHKSRSPRARSRHKDRPAF